MARYNKFDIWVIVFVILTGAGFGALTGLAYDEENYWWVGLIAGMVSGYPLAKLYLKLLVKMSVKKFSRKRIWLLGTLVAIGCGIISTTLIHGTMTLIILNNSDVQFMSEMDGLWSFILTIGEIIGACAGFIVGGICTLIYVLSAKGKCNELSERTQDGMSQLQNRN